MVNSIITYSLTIIGLLITLIAPVPIPQEYRIIAIAALLFLFIIIILSDFKNNLENVKQKNMQIEKQYNLLEEKLKIYERLSKLETTIEVIKNGKK